MKERERGSGGSHEEKIPSVGAREHVGGDGGRLVVQHAGSDLVK